MEVERCGGKGRGRVNFHWLLSNYPENPAIGNSAITVQAKKGRHPSPCCPHSPSSGTMGKQSYHGPLHPWFFLTSNLHLWRGRSNPVSSMPPSGSTYFLQTYSQAFEFSFFKTGDRTREVCHKATQLPNHFSNVWPFVCLFVCLGDGLLCSPVWPET